MYIVDDRDKVIEIINVPQSSVGAPLPFIMSDEHTLLLAYLIQDTPSNWDGTTVRIVDPVSSDEPIALINFIHYYSFMFGPPNDEAFDGHPLADRGLNPYSVFQIGQSSWIRQLERMNSVHPYHNPEQFEKYKHYIFAFHDSTFECIAEDFQFSIHNCSLMSLLPEMQKRFKW